MADRKRTILLPDQLESSGFFKKVKKVLSQSLYPESQGIGGTVVSFDKSNKPATTIGWEIGYKKGAGSSLKTKVLNGRNFQTGRGVFRQKTRGKSGPRLNIKVRF